MNRESRIQKEFAERRLRISSDESGYYLAAYLNPRFLINANRSDPQNENLGDRAGIAELVLRLQKHENSLSAYGARNASTEYDTNLDWINRFINQHPIERSFE